MLIGYARVSTNEQNLDLQRDALLKAGCERIFEEKVSGSRELRISLDAAFSHLRVGDTLVVWKLDRLGRTVRQLVELVGRLEKQGIHFASVTDRIDTSTASGRFFFHVMAALAEMERDLIRDRTRAGLVAAKARGRQGGRPAKLSGLQIDHARRLLADPAITGTDVARTLGVARSTLYRAVGKVSPAEAAGLKPKRLGQGPSTP